MLQAFGIFISKRQVVRLLNEGQERFLNEANAVLRAGLSSAAWITVDDTGARHQAKNGFCTQIGNAHFTWFGTTETKNRANFLHLLRAGHGDYVINTEALAYMRQRNLAAHVITRLAEHPDRQFIDHNAFSAHLKNLGVTDLKVNPDPVEIATEGALWGSIKAHGLLPNTVIVSDDAGQFNVGEHGLCWVHAERLVNKLDAFTDENRKAQHHIRGLIWRFYRDLKAYRVAPSEKRKASLMVRFDRIFTRQTGFVTLDRLLKRLHANKAELLKVLERPEIPLHTNGSENDIRSHVMVESLCTPSLSVWKDWKCGLFGVAIRASVSGDRGFDRWRGEVVGPDLIRRAAHDLRGRQNTGRDQLPYHVVADPQRLRCLAQGEPLASFFC
jgi:hypothetical protein